MPKDLERKLKKEYGDDSAVPYKIMNKMGVMKGNKEVKAKSIKKQLAASAMKGYKGK